MADPSVYPPGPPRVPANLATPNAEFWAQALVAFLSLGLFLSMYVGAMVVCGAFILWAASSVCFACQDPSYALRAGTQGILTLPAVYLLVLLLKNLFYTPGTEQTAAVEIFAHEQPRLFDFIYRVCADIDAPFPTRVLIHYDANAQACCYVGPLWRLTFGSHKTLSIGLALMNEVNLTEFKALVAHECAHFAQPGARLCGLLYTALTVLNRAVAKCNDFERFFKRRRGVNRLPWEASEIGGTRWSLDRGLKSASRVLFLARQSMIREMELNADLSAVRVCGSDAPIHFLFRAQFADACLNQAVLELKHAKDHHLYSNDLFYHQERAAAYLRRRSNLPGLGQPPALPAEPTKNIPLFEPAEPQPISPWDAHPSNEERERNAKAQYIRTLFDERSPWLLFDVTDALRAAVTCQFYQTLYRANPAIPRADPTEVQAFIDEEHAATEYDVRYEGLYDHRRLLIDDIDELAHDAPCLPGSVADLGSIQAHLYDGETGRRGQRYNQRLGERNLLLAVTSGAVSLRGGRFDFRGQNYRRAEAKHLLACVERELDDDDVWLSGLDRKVFQVHFLMARDLNPTVASDLRERYRFHIALQMISDRLNHHSLHIDAALSLLAETDPDHLDRGAFKKVVAAFRNARQILAEVLRASETMISPELTHLPAGEPLRNFLLEHELLEELTRHPQALAPHWVNKLADQMAEVRRKLDRVQSKSLGAILAVQERVSRDWVDRPPQLADPVTMRETAIG